MLLRPYWIEPGAPPEFFPEVELALETPNGLLAVGGDLAPERLTAAYRRGIFPWYGEGQPILWWSPEPRAVLFPRDLRISRSLRKTIRKGHFEVTSNTAFPEVIRACASSDRNGDGTWITPEMMDAYCRLHSLGLAHSLECWHGGELVGGLYGVVLGRVFFGESMFSRMSDASKVALERLSQKGFSLIDCQVPSAHLSRLGACNLARREFVGMLKTLCAAPNVVMEARG